MNRTETITLHRMAQLITEREALPVLRTGGVPEPVQHRDQYWEVPAGQDTYHMVRDPERQRALANAAMRVARITHLRRKTAHRDATRGR